MFCTFIFSKSQGKHLSEKMALKCINRLLGITLLVLYASSFMLGVVIIE